MPHTGQLFENEEATIKKTEVRQRIEGKIQEYNESFEFAFDPNTSPDTNDDAPQRDA